MRPSALTSTLVLLMTGLAHAADRTWTWQTTAPRATSRPAALFELGGVPVTLRPPPDARPKDAPASVLSIGATLLSKTRIYPGKRYRFALVSKEDRVQLFVNGFPDGEPRQMDLGDGVGGDAEVEVSEKALGAAQISARVKRDVKRAEPVLVVAHRGVHKHAPENTRISYVQALEAKAPVVEIDTALSKDGQVVLMHDDTVDRTTNGTGKVADLTADELAKLDAGSWKDPKYRGEPVPRLSEIADLCRGKAVMMLDLKAEGQGAAIAAWLKSSNFPKSDVILAPWTDAEGVALRKHVPDVTMIRLTSRIPTDTTDDAYFARMKQIGFSGFSVNWQYLTEAFTRAAQKNGIKVYVWTINDAPDIAGAALLGVDGIITDDPAATRRLVDELVPAGRGGR